MNRTLYQHCAKERVEFTRLQPGHKNDNAYIEEKNWTRVRKVLGYLRYNTVEEIAIIRASITTSSGYTRTSSNR